MGVNLAFLLSRFCRFYSLAPDYVLKMPVKLFWAMNSSLDAVRAEEEFRAMRSYAATNSEEAAKSVSDELARSMDSVYRKEFQDVVRTSSKEVERLKRLQG